MRNLYPVVLLMTLGLLDIAALGQTTAHQSSSTLKTERSVDEVLATIGPDSRSGWMPYFDAAQLSYPPKQLTLLVIKNSAMLEVWAETERDPVHLRSYDIFKLSGSTGPKLREGDEQVPEGIYAIERLNPNSKFHLSMKLNYPNEFDLLHAVDEGRTRPGSNIFIHGSYRSVGCLAMGNQTIEELFVLAADTGIEHIKVVIAPVDLRQQRYDLPVSRPWVAELYEMIAVEMAPYQSDRQ